MGRHKRSSKYTRPFHPLNPASHAHSEMKADGRQVVRTVPGERAVKTYTCPGCLHPILPGTPHVVAWPHDPTGFTAESPVSARRHWHTGCWKARP